LIDEIRPIEKDVENYYLQDHPYNRLFRYEEENHNESEPKKKQLKKNC
jgi:hypothetical protein